MLKLVRVLLSVVVVCASLVGSVWAACPEGDLDGNCQVDFDDVTFLADRWLEGAGSSADIVGSDGVNFGDFAIVALNFGQGGGSTGSVRVTISPPDVILAGAQWTVDGGELRDGGATVSGLSVGSHTIAFIAVPGWITPSNEIIDIIAGETESVSVSYSREYGSLMVDIVPDEAVAAGAQWRVDQGAWQDSGETVSDVYVGGHIVEFKEIYGWISATNRSVLVSEGALTAISAEYSQPLVISEFLTSNHSPDPPNPAEGELVDEEGDSSDWIEIYNPTDILIDLGGWYLTDNDSNLTEWQFPAGVELDGGEFLIVFASKKNRRNPAGPYLHTNFKLSSDPSYLALVSADGITIVHEYFPSYPDQLADVSYGLAQSATDVLGEGSAASYYVPTASDIGEDWTAAGFDDSSWDAARMPLSFATEAVEAGQDIGSPSAGGSHSANSGVYTVEGAGDDIWNNSDNFYYVYAPMSGDGELSARVVSLENTNDWAKAGVMIRETLTGPSKHGMQVVTPNGRRSMQWRPTTGGSSSGVNSDPGAISLPYWVKIVRSGNVITGYYASDSGGVPGSWAAQGSETISMDTNAYIGLCVTSHSDGVLCTAVFDNVGGNSETANDLMDAMLGVNASLWVRMEFNLEAGQADTFDTFNLRTKHEDGFVAYLNGELVAMDNNPMALTWNSTALGDRPIEDSQTFTSTNLMPYLDDLVVGRNVLAIQAMNDDKNNEEFLISAELVSTSEVGINQYFQTPTPGTYNVSGDMGAVGEVWFSHERGFYSSGFYLTLSTESSDSEIRYTIDGSTPTDSYGTVYVAGSPIYIDETTPLRAMAWKPGYVASDVMTHTYIFIADVLTQSGWPGSGWPSGSVNGQVFDYGMDSDVLNDSRYSGLVDDALLAIPSISLVTDLGNLFDGAYGIYVNPGGDGRGWERPSSVELINPDESDGFHINAGLRIRGGYSRGTWNPKHAFRLLFRSEYGEANLNFPLFEDEGVDEFDKVDLRTSQNYSWSHGGSGHNTMVREVFSRDIQGATDQPYTRSRYYHLYINGVYWGLYQTQERSESVHAASYMGGDRDDYDVVKTRGMYAVDGTREPLDRLYDETMLGLDSLERYYRVQGMNMDGTRNPAYERLLDVDNVIDFMIIEYYTGDRDGPASRYTGTPNNTYGAYNRVNPDGWKWYHHDNEHSLGAGSAELNMVEPFTTAGSARNAFNPHWLHQELANINVDYRMRFADLVYKRFYSDGLLTVENARAAIQSRADQIEMAIIAESARWGDASHHPAYTQQNWADEIDRLLYDSTDKRHITDRIPTVIEQFRDVGWYPSLEPPTFDPAGGGEVAAGQSLSMTVRGGVAYYTTDGSDPRLSAAISTSGDTVTLLAEDAAKWVQVPAGPVTSTTGSILYEYWNGISGSSVSDLTAHPGYPDSPDGSDDLTLFEAPTDWADYYGARISGYVHPPSTGNYRFWISSDDNSQLWLSSDENPANISLIAYEDSWSSARAWQGGNERSAQIYLQGGSKYYIEALMAEAGGGDNLAVTWDGPGGNPNPIPATYLSPPALPDTWAKLNYDHSSWASYSSGNTGVGYEKNPGDAVNYTDLIDIDVEPVMYGTNATCYIRIPFTVAVTDLNMLKLNIRYDDGFVAYINGSEVARRTFTGTPDWDSEADNGTRDDAEAREFEEIDITVHVGALQVGDNVLAIQGLNGGVSSSDFLISAELVAAQTGQGDPSPTAMMYGGPISLDKSMVVKARTYSGGAWSPLREASYAVGPVVDSLRITEIMYHPQYMGDPDDPNEEYIELQNIGSEAINLNQVRFTNGIDFTFGDIDVDPGEYVVVVAKQSAFEAKYPSFGGVFGGEYAGRLDNGGERIELVDAIGRTIHDFSYKDGWRSITDGEGFSLTIIDTSATPPVVSENGLVAHWKLDEGSGGTATDSAGSNDGTVYGDQTWATGRVDGALNLDGAGDYIIASSAEPFTSGSVTVSTWVKVTGLTGIWNPLLTQHDATNDGYYFYIYEDKPAFTVMMGGTSAAAYSPETIGWNEWHHLAGTNDGSTIRLYVDGGVKASASSTGLTGVDDTLHIGYDYSSSAYFSGLIDDVRIYNRALNDYEFGVSSDFQDRWGEKDSWRASVYVDGSPGWDDSGIIPNPGAIVINEVLSHSHGVAADWIELYNTTDAQIDVGGWYLSDGGDDLKEYMIAAGTKIDAYDYLVLYENTNFGESSGDPGSIVGFGLSEDGDEVYLSSGEGGVITGYRATEAFGASLTGVSFGRYFKTSTGSYNFVAMDHNTLDAANSYPKVGPIVISEIMYNPQSGDQKLEFIELHNTGLGAVTLYDSNEGLPWKFTDGVDYTFADAPGLTLGAGGYAVLVKDVTGYINEYGMPPFGVLLLGPYGGKLSNSGESVQLSRPGDLDEFGVRHYIRVDRVSYSDGSHPENVSGSVDLWPAGPDGGGASLHRISDELYGNDPNNWTAADPPTPGE